MKKKLIEVALPLEAINKESAREKSIRHGHPSTLHLWWARRPLAACRAVLFASLVDDPSSLPEQFPTEADQDKERQRLFRLIEELVKWDNSNNQTILKAAHDEILKSTDGNPPAVYDPFCGGGSIPLEAQRLGLEAHGSDLNPVAVLITKALIEIPPKFAGQPPVNPVAKAKMSGKGMWTGARGLADDVRYYGQWMRDRAFESIGRLYPSVKLPKESGGGEATVIAWLWARTAKCPNPACGTEMPLTQSFDLSKRPGSEAWLDPVVNAQTKDIRFAVRSGTGSVRAGTVNRRGAHCVACGTSVPFDHIRAEGRAGRIGSQLMAVIADGPRGRVFLSPSADQEQIASNVHPVNAPDTELPEQALGFRVQLYGMTEHRHLFTPRQLTMLIFLTELVGEARRRVEADGGSASYADAIATYLAFAVDKVAEGSSSLCTWSPLPTKLHVRGTFARQALPMVWDYAEANPFANSSGNIIRMAELVADVLEQSCSNGLVAGSCAQSDSTASTAKQSATICTDPPYYDNIGYADLSDFFYVWLRKSLASIYPELFATLLVPKKQELIASPFRFDGSRSDAAAFFEAGFTRAFSHIRGSQDRSCPLTVFYAFKQEETEEGDSGDEQASTGWETMLEGLLRADFQVTATWPSRSERPGRSVAVGTNALASSIVLACRPRPESAPITTRKDFLSSLKKELPHALRDLQKGNIAPVDLAQAAIGPGMAVFSRYKKVLETDGSPMRVRTALALINQGLDEVLSELESEFDPDTRWALAWFEQHQFDEGLYGEAEVLATAKALSISHLAETGILHSRAGKVRLLRREELPEDWDPAAAGRLTVWEVTQHLIRRLDQKGEKDTANLKAKIGGMTEIARDLAYRLYTLCERNGWAEEAGYYNSLVVAWPSMASEAFELS